LEPNKIKITWDRVNDENIMLSFGDVSTKDKPTFGTSYNVGDTIQYSTVLLSDSDLEEYVDVTSYHTPYVIYYTIWSMNDNYSYSSGIMKRLVVGNINNMGGFHGGVFKGGSFYGTWIDGKWIGGDFVSPPAVWLSEYPRPTDMYQEPDDIVDNPDQ
jgi:hypothetical protein